MTVAVQDPAIYPKWVKGLEREPQGLARFHQSSACICMTDY